MSNYRKITDDDLDIVLHLGKEREAVEVIHQTVPRVSCKYIAYILKKEGIAPLFNRPESEADDTREEGELEDWSADWLEKECRRRFIGKQINCRTQGIPFEVEFEDIEWPDYCPVFGILLDYFSEKPRDDASPEFDKVIPELGYVKGNVKIISSRANRIKYNGTMEEHFQIAWYIQEHMKE